MRPEIGPGQTRIIPHPYRSVRNPTFPFYSLAVRHKLESAGCARGINHGIADTLLCSTRRSSAAFSGACLPPAARGKTAFIHADFQRRNGRTACAIPSFGRLLRGGGGAYHALCSSCIMSMSFYHLHAPFLMSPVTDMLGQPILNMPPPISPCCRRLAGIGLPASMGFFTAFHLVHCVSSSASLGGVARTAHFPHASRRACCRICLRLGWVAADRRRGVGPG